MDATCIVLAAGRASRMGGDKLLLPFARATVLEAVLEACAGLPTLLVTSSEIARRFRRSNVKFILNDQPERGMAHSLRLANRAISAERTIAVLLGDKPLVTRGLVAQTLAGLDPSADVAFPTRDAAPGHPVVLSSRARALIAELRDGDTLHLLRDDPRLVRRPIPIDDDGAYLDIDTEADYRKLATIVPVS